MKFDELPREILYHIVNHVATLRDLNSLSLLNHEYCNLFRKELYKQDAGSEHPQALHWACYNGIIKTAQLAMEAGVSIDMAMTFRKVGGCDYSRVSGAASYSQFSPLAMAAYNGQTTMAKFLVELHAAGWTEERNQVQPLEVCDFSQPELVKLLLSSTPEYMDCGLAWWHSVLQDAMRTANEEGLDVLSTESGLPLHPQTRVLSLDQLIDCGVLHSNIKALKWLASHGANIAGTGQVNSEPPLIQAMRHNKEQVVSWLLDQRVDLRHGMIQDGILFLAIEHGVLNKSMVDMVLSSSDSLHARDLYGATPLHIACYKFSNHFVTYLIDKGADVNAVDYQGVTPLMVAASVNNTTAVRLLIQAGAKTDMVDNNGRSPLHWACWQDPFHLPLGDAFWIPVIILLKRSPGTAYVDRYGLTPLHVAVLYRQGNDIVDKLVAHGFDMDADSELGLTPRRIVEMMTPACEYWDGDLDSEFDDQPDPDSSSEPEALTQLREIMNGCEWGWYDKPMYDTEVESRVGDWT